MTLTTEASATAAVPTHLAVAPATTAAAQRPSRGDRTLSAIAAGILSVALGACIALACALTLGGCAERQEQSTVGTPTVASPRRSLPKMGSCTKGPSVAPVVVAPVVVAPVVAAPPPVERVAEEPMVLVAQVCS